jgi:uncharacterized protein YcfJ
MTMRPIVMIAGLAVMAGSVPAAAEAACQKRVTGTVVGAVAGGLLGNAVAGRGDRTEGALLGAAVGGFAGNQLTKCKRSSRAYYAPARSYRSASYDRPRYRQTSYYRQPSCRYETRIFYDPYGQPVQAPMRVCGG